MQVVYNGPHESVIVDEFDIDKEITRGEGVEIPDEIAARLLDQSTWDLDETPAQRKEREQAEKDQAEQDRAAEKAAAAAVVKVKADQAKKGNS